MSTEGTTPTSGAEAQKPKVKPKKMIFCLIPGVEGSCTQPGFEGWIKMDSCQWGVGCGVGPSRRRRRNKKDTDDILEEEETPKREISRLSVSEFSADIDLDASSVVLFHGMLNRECFPEARIEVFSGEGKKLLHYVLKEVVISGLSMRCKGNFSSVSLSLNFEEVEFSVNSELRRPAAQPKWAKEYQQPEDVLLGVGIGKINDELLEHVFDYLESKELVSVALVCHRFARVASAQKFEKISTHTAKYHLFSNEALLDGQLIPSSYIPKSDESDNFY